MQLITTAQRQKLLENGRAQRAALDQKQGAIDFEPVVELFTPDGNATWLMTELDPNGEYLAFGLCDLGLGEPELGYVIAADRYGAREALVAVAQASLSSGIDFRSLGRWIRGFRPMNRRTATDARQLLRVRYLRSQCHPHNLHTNSTNCR